MEAVWALGLTAIFAFASAAGSQGVESSASPLRAGFVDVHMHLDGLGGGGAGSQMGRGRSPGPGSRRGPGRRANLGAQGGDPSAGDALIELMDRHGVRWALIMPPPQGAGQQGSYDYRALQPTVERHPERLALIGGGGTLNPIIQGIEPGEVTDGVRRRFEAEAETLVRAGAKAFGEMTAMHFCLNPKHHYVATPPDHPLFLQLADLAARHRLPIDLHMEATTAAFAVPAELRQACSQNPSTVPATIPGLERLLAHNRRVTIVWQHIGWDNTGQMTVPLLRRLLLDHPNLALAIKAVIPRDRAMPNRLLDDAGSVRPEWLALMREFPDRFVVGADEFVRGSGTGGYKKPPFFEVTWQMIRRLPDDLLEKVGRENARRIYALE